MSQDPNLPAGCTQREIDRHMGVDSVDCDECDGSGTIDQSNCCGANIRSDGICDDCLEHCSKDNCERCDGTGSISGDKLRDEAAERRAEDAYERWKDERNNH